MEGSAVAYIKAVS